jgi:hypothetical protein
LLVAIPAHDFAGLAVAVDAGNFKLGLVGCLCRFSGTMKMQRYPPLRK